MIILGVQVALKKPLCIDSSVVYKIDRITPEKTENIYSCAQFKKVSFSKFFHERLDVIENQIRKAEIVLQQMNLPVPPQIRILPQAEIQSGEVIADTVLISEENLMNGGLLREMLELAIRSKTGSADREYIAALSDYIVGEDKPRRLISQAWGEAFAQQGFFEKRSFLRAVIPQLSAVYEPSQDAIFNLQKVLSLSKNAVNVLPLFTRQLEKRGYISAEGLVGRHFDIIVEIAGPNQKKLAAELLALARQSPDMMLAFKTTDGLFLLPSVVRVPDEIANELYADYRLVFTDKNISPKMINSHIKNSERLVFVEKTSDAKLNLKPLFSKGVAGFLSVNPDVNFVQLHLPSYRLKSSALNGIRDYFSFVRDREQQQKEHRALGWEKTEWMKEMKAYRPLAHFDVIQYFRIN